MFWSLGVNLTNSYVIFATMCDKDGVKKRIDTVTTNFLKKSSHKNSSVHTAASTAIRAMGSPTGSTTSQPLRPTPPSLALQPVVEKESSMIHL